MPDDPSPRTMRYRLIQSLVPLAASGAELVEYVHEHDTDIDEAGHDFVDWTYDAIPWLSAEGLLPDEVRTELEDVFQLCLAAMRSAPIEACEVAVQRAEYTALRDAARHALESFRDLGIPPPSLRPGVYGGIESIPESER